MEVEMSNRTRAVIPAARSGARLRPYTESIPNSLAEMIEIQTLHTRCSLDARIDYRRVFLRGRHRTVFRPPLQSRLRPYRWRRFPNASANAMLAGEIALLERVVFFERKILKRTLRTISSAKRSVATVAAVNASMSESPVELEGGCSTSFLNQTAVADQACHLFEKFDLTRLLAEALHESRVPTLHRPVMSGAKTACVLALPRWQPRAPVIDNGPRQYAPVQSQQRKRLAEGIFALPTGRAPPMTDFMSPRSGAKR